MISHSCHTQPQTNVEYTDQKRKLKCFFAKQFLVKDNPMNLVIYFVFRIFFNLPLGTALSNSGAANDRCKRLRDSKINIEKQWLDLFNIFETNGYFSAAGKLLIRVLLGFMLRRYKAGNKKLHKGFISSRDSVVKRSTDKIHSFFTFSKDLTQLTCRIHTILTRETT